MPFRPGRAPSFMGCARCGPFVRSRPGQRSGVIMRVANLSWGVCATVLIASAAHAEEPFGRFDDSPRFMLYVQKSVGAGHHKSMGLSFGFAMEQPMNNAKLLDLRYAPEGGSLFFNGLQLTGKPIDGLGFGSYGGE